MAIPPYMIPPNSWAAQAQYEYAALAHAQAQAQQQAMAQMHAHSQIPPHFPGQQQQMQMGIIPPAKPDIMTEEKLNEKGKLLFIVKKYVLIFTMF